MTFSSRDGPTLLTRALNRAVLIISFHVQDAQVAVARLDGLEVTWLVELERRPGGLFATFVDPDGEKYPADNPVQHRRTGRLTIVQHLSSYPVRGESGAGCVRPR